MEILATVCARAGSKGIPGKNTKKLNGKPLISYTLEVAKRWNKFSEIVVSTDDKEVMSIAKKHNVLVPFQRPKELASDKVSRIAAVKHALNFMETKHEKEYDFIIDLSVTSPFRKIEDIEGAFNLLLKNLDTNNVYTVCEADRNPYFNMVEINENGFSHLVKSLENNITNRQSAPKVYAMNDSINIFRRNYLVNSDSNQSAKTKAYIMPKERSLDIDYPLDFKFAEFLMQEEKNNER